MFRRVAPIVVTATVCALAHGVTFSGSSGSYSASADFEVVSNQLVVTLTNTSTADVMVPSDVLTGVFFNVTGDPALSRVSAALNAGSHVWTGSSKTSPDPNGTVIGAQWAYLNGLNQYSANEGVSSTGLGIFGKFDLFYGSASSPAGLNYGLTSAGDNPSTGNSKVLSTPLIDDSVVLTLGSLPGGFNLSSIGNVTFQYGTSCDDQSFGGKKGATGVPGPLAALPFVVGLAVGLRRRVRRT